MDMSTEIIAIDHGWSQIETPTFIFTTGVKKIRNKPAFMNDVLEYNGSYYKIGTERMEVKDNKFETQNFYLLTLAAIAKELSLRNRRNAEVLLAVGLPLTRFGEERKPFIDYLMKNRDLKFIFEEKEYNIRITTLTDDISYNLVKVLAGYEYIIVNAMEKNEPSIVARYVIALATVFNKFYHECNILQAEENEKKARLILTDMVQKILYEACGLLGMECPEEM